MFHVPGPCAPLAPGVQHLPFALSPMEINIPMCLAFVMPVSCCCRVLLKKTHLDLLLKFSPVQRYVYGRERGGCKEKRESRQKGEGQT